MSFSQSRNWCVICLQSILCAPEDWHASMARAGNERVDNRIQYKRIHSNVQGFKGLAGQVGGPMHALLSSVYGSTGYAFELVVLDWVTNRPHGCRWLHGCNTRVRMERVEFSCASGSFVRWATDSRNLGMNKVLAPMRLWRNGQGPPFFFGIFFLRTCPRTCIVAG